MGHLDRPIPGGHALAIIMVPAGGVEKPEPKASTCGVVYRIGHDVRKTKLKETTNGHVIDLRWTQKKKNGGKGRKLVGKWFQCVMRQGKNKKKKKTCKKAGLKVELLPSSKQYGCRLLNIKLGNSNKDDSKENHFGL